MLRLSVLGIVGLAAIGAAQGYYKQKADFSRTRLVLRVPPVVLKGDSLSIAVRMRNLGKEVVKLADIRLSMSSDSAGAKTGTYLSGEGMVKPRPIEIRPQEEAEVRLARPIPDDPLTLGYLRCGQPFYLELILAQFDDSLRPRTLTLTIGNYRRERSGVELRAMAFRYFVDSARFELEGRSYHPAPSSPMFLTVMTRRMMALEMDSSKTTCVARGQHSVKRKA